MNVSDIRNHFKTELQNQKFTIDKTGAKTIEILGASFLADEPAIFGEVNEKYAEAEIAWYESQSTNINDLAKIYGKTPAAWVYSANEHGEINSNYGHLIYSDKYHNQFNHVIKELSLNPFSRRAQLIYNRPSIWKEYNENGKSDFICTNAQTVYIRDNKLHMVSQMRSNDAVYGYKNDYFWAKYVMNKIKNEYNQQNNDHIVVGDLYWQVMNLHVYSKHFHLVSY
jgi:thymidylate synthase